MLFVGVGRQHFQISRLKIDDSCDSRRKLKSVSTPGLLCATYTHNKYGQTCLLNLALEGPNLVRQGARVEGCRTSWNRAMRGVVTNRR